MRVLSDSGKWEVNILAPLITWNSSTAETAADQLDNPNKISDTENMNPYFLRVLDNTDDSPGGGGEYIVLGYEHTNGRYGAQILFSYNGKFKFRNKSNNVWDEWKNIAFT